MKQKIYSLDILAKKISHCKQNGQTVVFCHGLFHFLHIGHIRYLKQAKNYGDVLIVSLKADKFIKKSETIEFDENLRAEAISSLDWIDSVIINPFEEVGELIERLRPDVFVRGFESKVNNSKDQAETEHEKRFFEKLGVETVIAKEENFDSTLNINRYISNLPDDVQNYLRLFKQRFTLQALIEPLRSMKRLKVLVIGDTIIDEYCYCTAIGKSSKDPTLALKYESHDIFAGGVLAIANHAAGFASQVDLFTILGGKDSHEDFIRSKLMKNVKP